MSLPMQNQASFEVVLPSSPYPGLRPFMKSEWPIFFGRERMVDEAIARLVRQHLLVVHGDSGCGKSSLIRAGVLARLEQEVARDGLAWRTCTAEPGESPLQHLAESLASLDGRPDDEARAVEIRRVLNFGDDAPRALMKLLRRGDGDHICILLDQFEELFAFSKRHGAGEARLLVQFLVGVLRQPLTGLYVVITMRSEFLGACAQFPGLAEAVNDAQYLLPRMGNLDLLRAIREPATLYGGYVSADLAQRLITDGGGTQDELPLIQHGLMSLHRRKTGGKAVDGDDDRPAESWRLELADYRLGPSLAPMLSAHADAVADQAEPPPWALLEKLFRALTEINADGQAVRRPQTLERLAAVCGAAPSALEAVITPFRAPGASFLRPYGTEPLSGDTRIDISHEALIRSWQRIADKERGWLVREFDDGLIWKSLLVQAASFERDRSNVLSASTAHERDAWLSARNEAWAERYGGGWTRVVDLVETSVAASRAALDAEKEAARKQRFRNATIFALLVTVLFGFAFYSRRVSDALTRTYEERAATLWSRLDFSDRARIRNSELIALWEVAAGRPDVRQKFIDQLSSDPERAVTLGKRPAPVMRSMFLRWPRDCAEAALVAVVRAIPRATDAAEIRGLGTAADALAQTMPSGPEPSAAVVQALAAGLEAASNADHRTSLGQAATALGPKLSAAQARELVAAVVKSLMTSSGTNARLAEAGRTLAGRLSESEARDAVAVVRGAIDTAAEDRADRLTNVAEAVASKVSRQDARLLFTDLSAALMKGGERSRLVALAALVEGLPAMVEVDVPLQRLEAVRDRIVSARGRDDVSIVGLGDVASAVSRSVQASQSAQALSTLVESIDATTDAVVLRGLGRAASEIAPKLHEAEVLAAGATPLSLLARTTDPDQRRALRLALEGLSGRVAPGDARAGMTRVLEEIDGLSDDGDAADSLGAIARQLAEKLPDDQRRQVLTRIVGSMAAASTDVKVSALAPPLLGLVASVPPAQVPSVVSRALAAMSVATGSSGLDALVSLVEALAPALTSGQAVPLLMRAVTDVARTSNDAQAVALSRAAGFLKLRTDASEAVAVWPRVLAAVQSTRETDAIDPLAAVGESLAWAMPAAGVLPAFTRTVAALADVPDGDQHTAFGKLLLALTGRMTPGEAAAALPLLIRAITRSARAGEIEALAVAGRGAIEKLNATQSQSLLTQVLATIARQTDPDQLQALSDLGRALVAAFTAEQTRGALITLRQAMAGATDDHLAAFAAVVPAMLPSLPGETQGLWPSMQKALTATTDVELLDAIGASSAAVASSLPAERAQAPLAELVAILLKSEDVDQHRAIGVAGASLAAGLSPAQAQMVATSLLEKVTPDIGSGQAEALGRIMKALAGRLSPEQARATLDIVRPRLDAATDRDVVNTLGASVVALATALGPDQQAHTTAALKAMSPRLSDADFVNEIRNLSATWTPDQLRQTMLSLIGWAGTSGEASGWTELLIERVATANAGAESSVRTIVEALKYPSTTGAPTETLLDGLKAVAASAPGKEGKLEGTFEWLAKAYPGVANELDRRPACPAPPSPDLTCPATRP